MWSVYLRTKLMPGADLTATDVAALMALLKLCRIRNNPTHVDSWVDLCGYGACGGGIALALKRARELPQAAVEGASLTHSPIETTSVGMRERKYE